MGFQVGASCYPTAEAAGHAIVADWNASAIAIALNTAGCVGRPLYSLASASGSQAVVASQWSRIGGTCNPPASATSTVALSPCGLIEEVDSVLLAWGIVAVWIAAAAVIFLRKGLHT